MKLLEIIDYFFIGLIIGSLSMMIFMLLNNAIRKKSRKRKRLKKQEPLLAEHNWY